MSGKNENNAHKEDRDWKAFFHYILIAALSMILLVGDAKHWFEFLGEYASHLARELGFAGMVAVILIISLEQFSKARHSREVQKQIEGINRDLFFSLFKKKFTEPIIGELQNILFYTKLCRSELELNYELTKIPNPQIATHDQIGKEVVKCQFTSTYVLENVTADSIEHELCTYIELPMVQELHSLCEISSVKVQHTLTAPVSNGDERVKSPIKVAAPTEINPKPLISLEHKTKVALGPYQKIRVRVRAQYIKNMYDTELWCTLVPTDGCRLNVSVPQGNLKVLATAHNSNPFEPIDSNATLNTWKLNSGMLPHQSVSFWWQPL